MSKAIHVPYHEYQSYSEEEMVQRAKTFRNDLARRRTIRDYQDKSVPKEVIEQCLLTAGSAPSGANLQPWHFTVITNRDTKQRLRLAAEAEEREFYNGRAPEEWLQALAPLGTDADKGFLDRATLIVVFGQRYGTLPNGERVKHYYVPESVGIACGFLIAALHNAGLATLTHTPSPMGFLNEICERPDNEKPYLLLVTGYPSEEATYPVHGKTRYPLSQISDWIA